jgi:hypothetical protein
MTSAVENAPAVPIYTIHHDVMLAGIRRMENHLASISADLRSLFGECPHDGCRFQIEQLVSELIELLDETENPDLEPDNDNEDGGDEEPSLGSSPCVNQTRWAQGEHAFCTRDVDGELDTADNEPSLASPHSYFASSQEHWAQGGTDDREDDPAEDGIGDADGYREQFGGAV